MAAHHDPKPRAVEMLRQNPFVEGDYYPGALLAVVVKVAPSFWSAHRDLYWHVSEIVGGLPSVMSDLTQAIHEFSVLAARDDWNSY